MLFERFQRPAVIAHRGASAHAPENTLAAFELALSQGADAIEMDVMLCGDQRAVIIHDGTVDRTTNGSGEVAKMRLSDLKLLDAGSSYAPQFHGEQIPTFEEVLDKIAPQIPINLELKNYASPLDDLPKIVSHLIKSSGLSIQFFISSFNPIALRAFQKHLPEVPIGLLVGAGRGTLAKVARLFGGFTRYQSYHPAYQGVTPDLVNRTHSKQQKIFTYTVNDPKDMHQLFRIGVDGIITDNPAAALDIAKEYYEK